MIPPLAWRPGDESALDRDRPFGRFRHPEFRPDRSARPKAAYRPPIRRAARPAVAVNPESEPNPPASKSHDEVQAKPRLRLSNPRWQESKGEIGGMATACVDAEAPPTAATRVVFRVWMEWGNGSRKDLPVREGHIPEGGGRVAVLIPLDPPPDGARPVRVCRYGFSAKHSLSESVAGGWLDAVPGKEPLFDGVILYAPARGEYLWLPDATAVRGLLEETGRLRGLRDRSLLAWENPDPACRAESLRDLAEESEALFGGNSTSAAAAAVEELLLVRKNPDWKESAAWVYARYGSGAMEAGVWRKEKDPALRAELDRLLSPEGERRRSPILKSKFQANLFRTHPKAGDIWHWSPGSAGAAEGPAEGRSKGGNGAGPDAATEEPRRFAFTREAALGRYFAGWNGGEASFETGKKKLALGCAGTASAALFEGAITLSVELPDSRGLNVIGWLAGVKHRGIYLADPKRSCRLKIRLQGSLTAFVGGSVQGALSISGNFTETRPAGLGAEGSVFVGAQVRGECRGALQWGPAPSGPFSDLAVLKGGMGASAGFGAEAKFKVGYAQGVFRFELAAGAAWGLGWKGSLAFDVGARNAWDFLGHLCGCVDFHFVAEITGDAFAAYRNYAFALMTGECGREESLQESGRAEIDWARHLVGHFAEWVRESAAHMARIKAEILARSGERSLLRKMPPETLGRVLATLMLTREPSDFQGIRYILGSAVREGEGAAARVSPDHKLKWVLRSVSDLPIPAADGPEREAKKREALEDGIRIIREFGMAEGRWAGAPGQYRDATFTAWFHRFLRDNGI